MTDDNQSGFLFVAVHANLLVCFVLVPVSYSRR